ncbi:MAG TPA: HEPN domain-containing protein [bacterium]|nr:HEPN domain-containing protein [bacterium]
MDEAFRRQAEEWFERGRHDIETAQLIYEQYGYTDSIVYHIQQAIEKYLKGYLVLRGRKPQGHMSSMRSSITSRPSTTASAIF